MIVAVTGSTGTLGQVVTQRLARDHSVTLITREDFAQPSRLASMCAVDAVVHCAGRITDTATLGQNLDLAQRLVTALASTSTRLLNFSTVAVYGATPALTVDEASPCLPVLDYGRNKLECEHVLDTLGRRVCHLRIGNVYSESALRSVVGAQLKRMLRGGECSNVIFAEEVAEIASFLLAPGLSPPVAINVTRDDLGPMTYADLYAMRHREKRSPHLPAVFAHWARLIRRQQSTTANRRFSNAALLRIGYQPMDFVRLLQAAAANSN